MATAARSNRKASTAKKASAQVTLNGRFPAGTVVALVEVDGEHVLRAEGGRTLERRKVDENGQVQFTKGVKAGARYFITGHIDGRPVEVRLTGRTPADDNALLAQSPVRPDETTTGLSPRVPVDPDSEPHGLRLAQEQVGDDVAQRSSTATGTGHPVDPAERGPYPDQASEEFSSGKVSQRSDTEAGQATPLVDVPVRQEDVPADVQQRSNTRTGVATPLPAGDAEQAVRDIESAHAKAAVGEPTQAEIRGGTEAIAGGGEPHEDAYAEDYVPVGPGEHPSEGHPAGRGLRQSEKRSSRRKR